MVFKEVKIYDNSKKIIGFNIAEPPVRNYSYVLYIEFSDGRTNSVLLEKENNICIWQVKAEHILSSGVAYIQIKAISENDEIWHSPKATVEIFESIEELSGQYSPTVLQQLDDKINEVNVDDVDILEETEAPMWGFFCGAGCFGMWCNPF